MTAFEYTGWPNLTLVGSVLRREYAFALGLTCCIPALRYVLHTAVYQPLARRVLCSNASTKTGSIPAKVVRLVDKSCESLWKLTVYASLLALGLYALHDQAYLTDSTEFWKGWPSQNIPAKVKLYYGVEGAFYTASVFMLLFWEERRKDFHAMMLHHVATSSLIAASYFFSYARVGSIVMLLHDPSDVFLEGAKLCNYADWDLPATTLFAALLVSWLALRLVLLPFWVVGSCLFEVQDVLGYLPRYNRAMSGVLCLLIVLHIYWFSMIARIAWDKITTGCASDSREDED
ncbi:ASC1-like protein 3 [Coccomyxa sp. Obi]|nr:ASC1-like protein 3 [Coccomyxa sp. Obi]